MKFRNAALILSMTLALSGCSAGKNTQTDEIAPTSADTENTSEISEQSGDTSETEVTEIPVYVPTETDKKIANWFTVSIKDNECFPDITSYQYYARTLGLDKDYFLNPEVWEVYYNEDVININKDIDNTETYLIRLNPYILLDIYAENNETTVDELCASLSVKKEQLYYNWGYNPASVDYMENHKQKKVTYSEKEENIFGKYNGENRDIVMSTHLLVYDGNKKEVKYKSKMTDTMTIRRRDILGAFSEKVQLYSEFSETEKQPAFKVNGIGIRTVVPFEMTNAFGRAADSELGDADVSVMINYSPYSYGCTDEDKIDIAAIVKSLQK